MMPENYVTQTPKSHLSYVSSKLHPPRQRIIIPLSHALYLRSLSPLSAEVVSRLLSPGKWLFSAVEGWGGKYITSGTPSISERLQPKLHSIEEYSTE